MKDKKQLIFLTAGGTGGHIYPAEAVATELLNRGYDVQFVTDARGKDNYKGSLGKVKNYALCSGALVGKSKLFKLKSMIKTGYGVMQALVLILRKKPKCVVGFGGYASFPCSVAAVLLGVKLVLHEQNSVMSRTNRLLGRFADVIVKSFADVKYIPENKKVEFCGMPIRKQIADLYFENRISLEDKFQILVLGGSQGAKVFAEVLPEAFKILARNGTKNLKIVQQCREDDCEKLKDFYTKAGIEAEISHFFADMQNIYRNSHLIISRAGASSVCEILATGIPSILVPLPIAADNHQYFNALNVVDENAGMLLEQKDMTAQKTAELLLGIEDNPSTLEFLSQNAKNAAVIDAARRFADVIENQIK